MCWAFCTFDFTHIIELHFFCHSLFLAFLMELFLTLTHHPSVREAAEAASRPKGAAHRAV
jgi:hypothetical protein